MLYHCSCMKLIRLETTKNYLKILNENQRRNWIENKKECLTETVKRDEKHRIIQNEGLKEMKKNSWKRNMQKAERKNKEINPNEKNWTVVVTVAACLVYGFFFVVRCLFFLLCVARCVRSLLCVFLIVLYNVVVVVVVSGFVCFHSSAS